MTTNPAPLRLTTFTCHLIAAGQLLGPRFTFWTIFNAIFRVHSPKFELIVVGTDAYSTRVQHKVTLATSFGCTSSTFQYFLTFVNQLAAILFRTMDQILFRIHLKGIHVSLIFGKVIRLQNFPNYFIGTLFLTFVYKALDILQLTFLKLCLYIFLPTSTTEYMPTIRHRQKLCRFRLSTANSA